MARVKICGIKTPEDVEIINELKPEYVTFSFFKTSLNYIPYEKAKKLKEMLDKDIKVVGVFVNENTKIVASVANDDLLDLIEFHGNEGPGEIERIRAFTQKPIIQGFRIKSRSDIEVAVDSLADNILLYSDIENGVALDWKLLSGITRPYFLAGGLNTDNLEKAIKICHPFAVSVTTGVETDGVKDREKMDSFIKIARRTK